METSVDMKTPWANEIGLARLIAIFASALGIATGLCGLNFLGLISLGGNRHPAVVSFLAFAAYAELLVMAVSFVALIILAVVYIVRTLLNKDK